MNGRLKGAKWFGSAAIVAALALLIGGGAAFSVAAGKKADKGGRELFAAASKAMGEAIAWTTRSERGLHIAWNTPGWGTLRADYTRLVKKPDKMKIDDDNSAYDHPFFRMYYLNGDDAWYNTNLNVGRNPAVTQRLKDVMERADGLVYLLAACDTFFSVGSIEADSILADVARISRAGCVLKGDTILLDVDAKTHLPVRKIDVKEKRQSVYDDYRKAGGRRLPFHVTVYVQGAKAEEFVWKEIVFNEPIEDAVFEEYRPSQPAAPPKQ